MNRLYFFGIIILFISCKKNPYVILERDEIASGVRYDSLFLGVKFGMSSKEFYCFFQIPSADEKRKILKVFSGNDYNVSK